VDEINWLGWRERSYQNQKDAVQMLSWSFTTAMTLFQHRNPRSQIGAVSQQAVKIHPLYAGYLGRRYKNNPLQEAEWRKRF